MVDISNTDKPVLFGDLYQVLLTRFKQLRITKSPRLDYQPSMFDIGEFFKKYKMDDDDDGDGDGDGDGDITIRYGKLINSMHGTMVYVVL